MDPTTENKGNPAQTQSTQAVTPAPSAGMPVEPPDILAEIDAIASVNPAPPKAQASKLPPQAKTPEPAKPAPEAAKAPEAPKAPEDQAKPADQPTDKPAEPDITTKYHTAHDLRRELRRVYKLAEEQKNKVKELETKFSSQPKEDPERKALSEKLTTYEKKLQDYENEIRHSNYTKSEEYRTKYQEPFEQATADAYSTVKELTVEQEDGTIRTGTPEDFDRLMALGLSEAHKHAKALFGDAAPEIMAYRRKLKEIQQGAQRDIERYRTEGQKLEEQKLAESTRQKEVVAKAWNQWNEELPKKYPQFFADDPEDPEGNEALKKGYAEVDRSQDPSLSMEERIARHASIRHRAAAFSREVLRRKRLETEVAELRKALEDYEKSAPSSGSQTGAPSPKPEEEESVDSMIDKIAGVQR